MKTMNEHMSKDSIIRSFLDAMGHKGIDIEVTLVPLNPAALSSSMKVDELVKYIVPGACILFTVDGEKIWKTPDAVISCPILSAIFVNDLTEALGGCTCGECNLLPANVLEAIKQSSAYVAEKYKAKVKPLIGVEDCDIQCHLIWDTGLTLVPGSMLTVYRNGKIVASSSTDNNEAISERMLQLAKQDVALLDHLKLGPMSQVSFKVRYLDLC
jgi:hypothetical protein